MKAATNTVMPMNQSDDLNLSNTGGLEPPKSFDFPILLSSNTKNPMELRRYCTGGKAGRDAREWIALQNKVGKGPDFSSLCVT